MGILSKYKAFMTEISMVKCKIILLVNGQENYSDLLSEIHEETNPTEQAKLREKLAALKETDRANMTAIADKAAKAVHPDNHRRFVKLASTDKTELNKKIPFEIHREIADQKPSSGSAVRTFEKMALAMASRDEALKQHKMDMAGEIERLEKAKADAEYYNNVGLYGGGTAAGAVAAGTLYVTAGLLTGGVAWVAGAAAAAAATSGAAYTFVYDGHADEKAKELKEQSALLKEEDKILTGAKLREDNFKELCRFCEVDHVKYLENLKARKGLEQ